MCIVFKNSLESSRPLKKLLGILLPANSYKYMRIRANSFLRIRTNSREFFLTNSHEFARILSYEFARILSYEFVRIHTNSCLRNRANSREFLRALANSQDVSRILTFCSEFFSGPKDIKFSKKNSSPKMFWRILKKCV